MKLFQKSKIKKFFDKRLLLSFPWQVIVLALIVLWVILVGYLLASFCLDINMAKPEKINRFGHPVFWGLAHLIDGGFSGDTIENLKGESLFIKSLPYLFAFLGITITSLFTGAFADVLAKRRELAAKGFIPYSFSGNHIIIIGWDFQCRELLRKLHEEKPKAEIVILTQHESDEIKNELNSLMNFCSVANIMKKVFVIRTDYTNAANYSLLNIGLTDSIFIIGDEHLSGRDTLNLSVLKIVYQALEIAQTDHRRCFLHIADTLLFEKLKKENLLPVEQKYVDLRVVNFYDSWAWKCWSELDEKSNYLPLHFKSADTSKTHLVIAGFGSMGKALALAAARLMNYGNSFKGSKLTVIDPNENCRNDFENIFGNIDFPELETEFITERIQSPQIQKILIAEAEELNTSLTIVLALPDLDQCLKTYYSLSLDIKKEKVSFLLWLAIGINAGNLPEVGMLKGNMHYADVNLFGMRNQTPWYDREKDLRINAAQDVNDAYCGVSNNPTKRNENWDDLPENLKQSNYSTGDSFKERICAAGFRLTSCENKKYLLPLEENPTLCAAEHNRWLTDRMLLGWHYTENLRNDELLQHPDIVKIEQLSPGEQKKDAVFTAVSATVSRNKLAIVHENDIPHYTLSCIGSRNILQLNKKENEPWQYPVWSKLGTLDKICCKLKDLKEAHPDLIMYNSLAIGADELFWIAARKVGVPVVGILPLPVEKYAKDFAEGREKIDFYWRLRGCERYISVPESPRPECYTVAAEYMLERSNELWAITDGSKGKNGGTLETLHKSQAYESLRSHVFVLEKTLKLIPFTEGCHTNAE